MIDGPLDWRTSSHSGSSGSCVELAKLPDGTVLIHQGESPDDVYVLASGRLRVEIDGARDTVDLRATGCDWERAGQLVGVELA